MTKTMIKKYLEAQQEKALCGVNEAADKAVDAAIEECSQKLHLTEAMTRVEGLLDQIGGIVNELKRDTRKQKLNRANDNLQYGSTFCTLDVLLNKGAQELVRAFAESFCVGTCYGSYADSKTWRGEIFEVRDKKRNEIKKSYAALLANVTAMPTAKAALEYLQDLGLDISDLLAQDQKQACTALMTPVDIGALGIPVVTATVA